MKLYLCAIVPATYLQIEDPHPPPKKRGNMFALFQFAFAETRLHTCISVADLSGLVQLAYAGRQILSTEVPLLQKLACYSLLCSLCLDKMISEVITLEDFYNFCSNMYIF